ncbi:ATP-binding protein [uncultured Gimesia sp.]|uniref:AAA family ATPase n=1 Tax=uncultured Gimesia sp. TaxID=1678688 RepID=UPI00260A4047|nr:ATP-binding protein [uncultured Gimesia sp.]
MTLLEFLLIELIIGTGIAAFVIWTLRKKSARQKAEAQQVAPLLKAHFDPVLTSDITISERKFPFRVRADLQRAIDRLFDEDTNVLHFCGVSAVYSQKGLSLTSCFVPDIHSPAVAIPPEYEEVNVGGDDSVRVLKIGLWLLEKNGVRFAVLLSPIGNFGRITGLRFQVGTPNSPEGTEITQQFFRHLEAAIIEAKTYRGKVLSLEKLEHSYSGESKGINVHQLRTVTRDQVILPEPTIELLERNVIQFVAQRAQLAKYKQATKKGILFYGPPGTGKTHTIHYLANELEAHTTLLISAEQVGMLDEYMSLARLLQPSIVVLEDVDLIARDRRDMNSACEEVLLNKLLNEMDGLKQDCEVLFILTTNRPETLEAALASRPGRVDQAIEFPLPDEAGRKKLIQLYATGVSVSDEVVEEVIRRTEKVSASFIKELVRRSVQFHLERKGTGDLSSEDVINALDEMLVRGGSLNLKLLGAEKIAK